jgi:hypothetical protein
LILEVLLRRCLRDHGPHHRRSRRKTP